MKLRELRIPNLVTKLSPKVHLYLEFSNEVWNSQFSQFHANYSYTLDEVSTGQSNLNRDGEGNSYYLAWRRVSKRLVEISTVFRRHFNESGNFDRIRPVLASQIGYPFVLNVQLQYLERVYGPVKNSIYAIAGAPYYGGPDWGNTRLTLDQVMDGFMAGATNAKQLQLYHYYYSMSQAYEIPFLAYEGGNDTGQSEVNLDLKIQATQDPRMKTALKNYLAYWYGCGGGGLFSYFNLTGMNSKWGQWGLTDAVAQESPKTKAISELAEISPLRFQCNPHHPISNLIEGFGSGRGMKAEYFNDPNFSEFVDSRVHPLVQFYWSRFETGEPIPGLNGQFYSVRFSGQIDPLYSEPTKIILTANQRGRVYIDGALEIDAWDDLSLQERSATIPLHKGQTKTLEILFSHATGAKSELKLEWESASQPRALIPKSQMNP